MPKRGANPAHGAPSGGEGGPGLGPGGCGGAGRLPVKPACDRGGRGGGWPAGGQAWEVFFPVLIKTRALCAAGVGRVKWWSCTALATQVPAKRPQREWEAGTSLPLPPGLLGWAPQAHRVEGGLLHALPWQSSSEQGAGPDPAWPRQAPLPAPMSQDCPCPPGLLCASLRLRPRSGIPGQTAGTPGCCVWSPCGWGCI